MLLLMVAVMTRVFSVFMPAPGRNGLEYVEEELDVVEGFEEVGIINVSKDKQMLRCLG